MTNVKIDDKYDKSVLMIHSSNCRNKNMVNMNRQIQFQITYLCDTDDNRKMQYHSKNLIKEIPTIEV